MGTLFATAYAVSSKPCETEILSMFSKANLVANAKKAFLDFS